MNTLVSSVFFQKFPDVRRDQKQTKVWGAKKDVEEDKNWTAGAGATKRKWEDEDHQWKGEEWKKDYGDFLFFNVYRRSLDSR